MKKTQTEGSPYIILIPRRERGKSIAGANRHVCRSRAGFTFGEIITVVAVLAILAAIAIPSVIAFINYGNHQNRMNIARTIYLAAQGELTNRRIQQNLKLTLTGTYYGQTDGIYDALPTANLDHNNVAAELGVNFPAADAGRERYVHYISKPAGYRFLNDGSELDSFYSLLNGIIVDKEILNGAILMEYNIETGVIMSIFYGDALEEGDAFGYTGTGKLSVMGTRGMGDDGYSFARSRNQGYYGAEGTGEIDPIDMDDFINIYDGIDEPLMVGMYEIQNVLYVKMLLAKNINPDGTPADMPAYSFELVGTDITCRISNFLNESLSGLDNSLTDGDDGLIYLDNGEPELIQNGVDIGMYYKQYVWIIDYIDGDILNSQPLSIGVTHAGLEPVTVRAKASRDGGASITSLTSANTHFYSQMTDGKYELKSARHLNNIRYFPDDDFRQTGDINMSVPGNVITNFAPIEDFSGTYIALKSSSVQYIIRNLIINTTALEPMPESTGLFASSRGAITGLALFEADISAGGGNTGAIAGTLENGGRIVQSYSYANISAGVGANAGGLVGRVLSGAVVSQSFNAGFYNARMNSETAYGIGSVTILGGSAGGLVGLNEGMIQSCFNNARVNIKNVEFNEAEGLSQTPGYIEVTAFSSVGGIAGSNVGMITGSYATNFVSLSTDHSSLSGGVAGSGTGSQINCFFLSNGSAGKGALSKQELFDILIDSNSSFDRGKVYVEGDNLYSEYPYPTLKNNNPFSDIAGWGWEDILDFSIGPVEFMYYERYDDSNGTFGYSHSPLNPLAGSTSGRLVTNEGYLLDFEHTSKLTITIDGNKYVLTDENPSATAEDWRWADNSHARKLANVPVEYTTTIDGETVTRYRLFFENSVLESYAKGAELIDFEVNVQEIEEPIVSLVFNPLFGNTIRSKGAIIARFPVRSPRHLDNIDSNSGDTNALDACFEQGMNIDFEIYRKELAKIALGYEMSDIELAGDKMVFGGSAVVTGEYTGEYYGRNLFIRNLEARFGIFAQVGTASEPDARLENIILHNSTISGINSIGTGGIAGENYGVIEACAVSGVSVPGGNRYVGGIAGKNHASAAIIDCFVSSSSEPELTAMISGAANQIGGIAGENQGSIVNCSVISATVLGGTNEIGGIAGINGSPSNTSAAISGCIVTSSAISGANSNIGGITGINFGAVDNSTVRSDAQKTIISNRSGGGSIGGIAGSNNGNDAVITGCSVLSATVSGRNESIGGIAGINSGRIDSAGVKYSEIKSATSSNTGGIAGSNTGVIEDVFFLSVDNKDRLPVSVDSGAAAGGITGNNNSGSVIRALFIAPAPSRVSGGRTVIYPIVRNGNDAIDSFYLSGHRYSLNGGTDWINEDYNLIKADETVVISGGGRGMVTDFIDLEWLNYAYSAGFPTGKWYQPTSGYPYPLLNGMDMPDLWPQGDSPARPDQLDRFDWEPTLPTTNRAQNLSFINGGFELPLMNPNNSAETYGILRIPQLTTAPSSSQNDPANVDRGGFNTSTNSNIPEEASPAARNGGDYFGMYTYYNADYVQGWNTRPVNSGDASNIYANMIEFQRPYSADLANNRRYGRVRTNFEGELTGTYVELNAQVPGTLYQICATVPGTELYYSFYHARRNAGNETAGNQRMNFYLSGMEDNSGTWQYANGTGRPTIIRPCITPRGTSLAVATTRNTVAYGTTGSDAGESVSVGRVDFYDPKTGVTRNAYLYDVWIDNLGYGISFWSNTRYSVSSSGATAYNQTTIPLTGVVNMTDTKNLAGNSTTSNRYFSQEMLNDAKNNVIGYWHVEQFESNRFSEWKQYYGLYTIPDGQITTEFAYESASTRNAQEGNYLDGITFQTPGFLSIEKYVKLNGAAIGDMNVKFVKPGDKLTVFLSVKNWGEVSANNIVITDRLSPYDAYISYAGNVRVDGTVVEASRIIAPNEENNHTLTVTLDPVTALPTYGELVVSFDIEINSIVSGIEGTSTLLYYFRNQALASYCDVDYRGYADIVKKNASGPEPVQVFIDPINLSKTVAPIIDGPFVVTLTVENTLPAGNSITTSGLINDLIPKGFQITDKSKLPQGTSYTLNPDGTTRITIPSVNLNDTDKKLSYQYTLAYQGRGYGMVYTSVSADYKYLYNDGKDVMNVMLSFPQRVAAISVKTSEDTFEYDSSRTSGTVIFDILRNADFDEELADDNYDISPEVVLLENGVLVSTNADGDYQINHEAYTAVLIRSTNQLRFEPKPGITGSFELQYQILLTAAKPGAASYELNSNVTAITIHVLGDAVVYYEKYTDGTGAYYGFYGLNLPMLWPGLNDSDTLELIESGYGVLSTSADKYFKLDGGEEISESEDVNGVYLYRLGEETVDNLDPLTVYANDIVLGKIHPNFARAVYDKDTVDTGKVFFIRTERQKANIYELAVDLSEISFIYERGVSEEYNQASGEVSTSGPAEEPSEEPTGVPPDLFEEPPAEQPVILKDTSGGSGQ